MESQMKHSLVILIVLSSILSISAQEFDTLQSRNVYGTNWWGKVQLKRDHKKVTVHETYLEIEEEVELSPIEGYEGEPEESQKNSLEISGQFPLPKSSVVTGAIVWDGEKILKSKLKPLPEADKEFNDTLNNGDEWVPSPQDPMQIGLAYRGTAVEQNDIYDFRIYPARWGSSRRLRIRYLLPIRNVNDIPTMYIPKVFADAISSDAQRLPQEYSVDLKGADGITSVTLMSETSTFSRPLSESPITLIQPHDGSPMLRIERPDFDVEGLSITTKIDTGDLAGEFRHFYSTVPNELFLKAGLKREVVFLWRWENENSFVNWKNQDKYLSSYGVKAVKQAKNILDATYKLLDGKAGVGMVLDRSEDSPDTVFNMAYRSTKEADTLINYLQYLIQDDGKNITDEISGYEVTNETEGDSLTSEEIDSISRAGKADFEVAIESIKTLFSPDEKVVKHVVLITVGKRKTDVQKTYIDSIAGLDGVTFSCYGTDNVFSNGYWPGVNLRTIHQSRKLIQGENMNGYRFPRSRTANFVLYMPSSKKTHSIQITGKKDGVTTYYDRIQFTGHATDWLSEVTWTAQDAYGATLASITQTPKEIFSENDTNLVMLWGGSSSGPISEKITTGAIGCLVGFVDESYSLLAMNEDSVTQIMKELLEDGGDIENLTEDEIIKATPITSDKTAVSLRGLQSVIATGAGVKFTLDIGSSQNASLVIYDLKGRVIMRFTHEQLKGITELIWDGKSLAGSSVSTGMYVARLTMDNYSRTVKFVR